MHHHQAMVGTALRTALYTRAMFSATNPSACPLCGQANQCAMAAGLPPETCWCMQASIAPEALERIPTEQRGQACVCPACGQAPVANRQPS